ncbi:ABC transporter substrate-binding protein [Rhizobium sp. KVB221]|uniref:ABC transporter substrate-binding protein n=1 Tax=Rhizobium setariae TaxID=2801340 RepID=A0A937CND1_9HYPH|nr:ABC transporter substrate-binding protein [Rhizobium setariae]MBL0371874.1 ABC transporter substrate-binding protein [Rhizobium setariae]
MPVMNLLRKTAATLSATLLVLSAATAVAQAENVKLRFAYLLADSMLPIMAAKKAGAYEKAGIDLELTEVQGGPAVVAAIASGDADIGYAAPVPPINARLNGVNVKMVLALGHEVDPDKKFIWLVASKASGVAKIADIKGKKISFNANGSLCELAWRDHLMKAGVTFDDIEPVVLPFPQQEAALEQASIDAACTVNPFYSSISANKAIDATVIAEGMLADEKEPVINDVVFATDEYLVANRDVLKKFAEVTDAARKEMQADRAKEEAAAVEFLGLTADTAKTFQLPIVKADMSISTADVQKLLDAMHKTGMLPAPVTADEMVDNLAD